MSASVVYPQRVALISMHTSPLATPGVGDAGGLNVYVGEVARRLGERGLKVDVFTRAAGEDRPPIVEVNEHTRVIHVPVGPAAPVAKEDLLKLVHGFGECLDASIERYDLIHSHYWLSGMVARRLRAGHGIPMVHTMHTMARVKNSSLSEHQTSEPNDRERGEAAIVAEADVLTANTPDEAVELERHYGATTDQIRIVPPGVDLHTFHPCDQVRSRDQFGVDQDKQIILFVGRIQPLKAPDVLIRAVAELAKKDPTRRDRLRLIIIGSPSGPDSEWSETLTPLARDLEIGELVIFRPHSPRADLFRWYCVADVVGVPSYNESFGLVALEAQACGTPVVAASVGGLRTAVRDGVSGVLVDGRDPGAYAAAVRAVLERRELMGAGARRHAAAFSWDRTADALFDAYAAAAAEMAGATPRALRPVAGVHLGSQVAW